MLSLLAGALALAATGLAAAALTGSAHAAQVAYVDGGQVWVSTLDGAQKRSLSGPAPAPKQWTEVAQADGGAVLGVQREPGKMGNFNATTLWNPDGSVAGNGTLSAPSGWNSYAYPVTLDLTPDGTTTVYGYANWRGFGLETVYAFGTYAERSTDWYTQPFDIEDVEQGTLVGNRLVGHEGDNVFVQRPTGQPPYSYEFDYWFSVAGVDRVDVSANGTVAAVEYNHQVAMVPFAGLGAPPPEDGSDCMLPTVGAASDVSISQDGTSMAWKDDRGVIVAGTPVWFPSLAVSTCNLSRPPVVISATGTMPSIGASSAATPPVPAGTAKKGKGPRLVSPPKSLKAAALRNGVVLKVKVAGRGKVTATGKVGKKLVAKGSVTAKRAGTVQLRLKATKAYRDKLGSLVGKRLKVKVLAGGKAATLVRKLG